MLCSILQTPSHQARRSPQLRSDFNLFNDTFQHEDPHESIADGESILCHNRFFCFVSKLIYFIVNLTFNQILLKISKFLPTEKKTSWHVTLPLMKPIWCNIIDYNFLSLTICPSLLTWHFPTVKNNCHSCSFHPLIYSFSTNWFIKKQPGMLLYDIQTPSKLVFIWSHVRP